MSEHYRARSADPGASRRSNGRPAPAGLTRRRALTMGALGAAALPVTAGCDLLSTKPDEQTRQGSDGRGAAADTKEAPELAERAKRDEIPPLEERLPSEPLVVEPLEEPGRYGGTWNRSILGPSETPQGRTIGYEGLVRWSPDWLEVLPNVAKSWEISAQADEFTFELREGIKWSDGEPFTTEDIRFAYEDVLFNEEYSQVPPSYVSPGGEPATIEKLSDYRVKFSFSRPNSFFLSNLCTASGADATRFPKHYLKKYHPEYNPSAAGLAEEEGYDSWSDLLGAMADWENVDIPRIYAWQLVRAVGEGQQVEAVRNPYYWKIDTSGRQLPYLDNVMWRVLGDRNTTLLAATNGEIDTVLFQDVNIPENKPVLARSRQKGNYHFVDHTLANMNWGMIALNLNHEDGRMREIFQDKDFRIGLSHAINREELIDAVFQRQGEPWQGAPRPESAFYHEKLAKQFTQFDPAMAGTYLDKAGFGERDDSGYRTGPDGRRFSFTVEVEPEIFATTVPMMELVKGYWNDVGIDARIKPVGRSLFIERREANKPDAVVWPGGSGHNDSIFDPDWYMPWLSRSDFARLWAAWYQSGGEGGERPPAGVREQMEVFDGIRATPDRDTRRELFRVFLDMSVEQFYVLGTVLPQGAYGIVKNDFHNVPKNVIEGWNFQTPGPLNPEQFWSD